MSAKLVLVQTLIYLLTPKHKTNHQSYATDLVLAARTTPMNKTYYASEIGVIPKPASPTFANLDLSIVGLFSTNLASPIVHY